MRKALGLFFATSLLVPAGMIVTNSAGAATAKGPTCKTLTATGTYKPPLPIISTKPNPPKINSVNTATGKIGGCTGGPVKGVTSGVTTSTFKYLGNCNTFATGKGGVTTAAKSSIKWNNGKVSVTNITTKALSKPGVQPAIIQLTTKILSGQYKGAVSVSKAKGTAVAGACLTKPLGAFKLVGIPGSGGFK